MTHCPCIQREKVTAIEDCKAAIRQQLATKGLSAVTVKEEKKEAIKTEAPPTKLGTFGTQDLVLVRCTATFSNAQFVRREVTKPGWEMGVGFACITSGREPCVCILGRRGQVRRECVCGFFWKEDVAPDNAGGGQCRGEPVPQERDSNPPRRTGVTTTESDPKLTTVQSSSSSSVPWTGTVASGSAVT